MSPFPEPAQSRTPEEGELRIAVQSAVATALCLGLSTGSFFWLITMQRAVPSAQMDRLVNLFARYLVPPDLLEMIGAFVWGLLLSKISGYRKWWRVAGATFFGNRVGVFILYSILLTERLQEQIPAGVSSHARFGIILALAVLSVTVSTGLLLGFVLVNWKASLVLGASTALASVLAVLITVFILGELGIRVGSGNAAMPRVTATATMAAALSGGAVLGILFRRYVSKGVQV
jgi:hypothetical protein